MKTGLASVAFRQLKPAEIVKLVGKAGLDGIEWGGDIHVPSGDIKQANEVLKMTMDEGLEVSSYGSYYRLGCGRENKDGFDRILATAVQLKAPVIRVWAGNRASAEADEAYWNAVAEDAFNIAGLAQKSGVQVALEYHEDTLTDTPESACRLLREVNNSNLRSYWQTHMETSPAERLEELRDIAPWLVNVHIFSMVNNQRTELAEIAGEWKKYMEVIRKIDTVRYCMLEFVKDNSPQQFFKDAETLKYLVGTPESISQIL
jgi:3-dehydroshikimate dehydratase